MTSFDFELIHAPDSDSYMITLPDRGGDVAEPVFMAFEGHTLVLLFQDGETLPLGPFEDAALRDLGGLDKLLITEVAENGDIARAYYALQKTMAH